MNKSLAASDFASFYKEVHGHQPFDWQKDLADTVCSSGWPKYLDMPTASGKTSVIDIAVFHLATEGRRKGRRAPMRIAFVVDRRLVVDGALQHAKKIADRISRPSGKITRLVADSLGTLSPGRPLETVRLRGGMPQEVDWAKTPSQPTVIVSTVDQVGSRLLFRGYGVSDSMKPVHAGLLGTDTLFLLDEAHTSRPFLDTLDQISALRRERKWDRDIPFACMFMSATLGEADPACIFPPSSEKKRLLHEDSAMRDRLSAHKRARLVEVPAGRGTSEIINAALGMAYPKNPSPGSVLPKNIGIVVNRVNTAREIHGTIRERLHEYDADAAAHLLTGRARPLDRDLKTKSELDRIVPGGGSGNDHVTFFVSTQCVEVGVDADFDALVTQIAPLDSLRQRFGRLDRIGRRRDTEAVIVATKEETSKRYVDPVYGDRIPTTWKYLKDACRGPSNGPKKARRDVVDFGVDHFPVSGGWEDAIAPKPRSVTLMPQYVDMWAQTRPRPDPDPDPAVFLHGPKSMPPDVQVVWRADVTYEMLSVQEGKMDMAKAGLLTCRPSVLEAVSLPVWTARRWLGRRRAADGDPMSDLEGAEGGGDDRKGGRQLPCAILWRGVRSEETRVVTADEIRPGDTVVVPAERGGCDEYGWDEGRSKATCDIGMEACLFHRNSLTMRFGGEYLSQVCDDDAKAAIERVAVDLADEDVGTVLDEIACITGIPAMWKEAMDMAASTRTRSGGARPREISAGVLCSRCDARIDFRHARLQKTSAKGGRTVIAGVRIDLDKDQARALIRRTHPDNPNALAMAGAGAGPAMHSTDDGGDGEGGRTVPSLARHCRGVKEFTQKFAERIGMNDGMISDLTLAALLHDAGKAEKRVQAFLHRMDPDDLPDGYEVVAKSADELSGPDEYYRCMDMARLPRGYRHECWSVLMAESHPDFQDEHDRDLVRYIIGTHHGHGRPLFPPVEDMHATGRIEWHLDGKGMTANPEHGLGKLGSYWVDMCGDLYRKYGPWGLAHMEAVVRLADHCQSGAEEKVA